MYVSHTITSMIISHYIYDKAYMIGKTSLYAPEPNSILFEDKGSKREQYAAIKTVTENFL